jgi:DNA-binding NtrC family response regulator
MIGESPQMKEVRSLIQKIAGHKVNVLITGASGTGKELVARAIHQVGPQNKTPFVAVNCSAIPEGLLESELFGHAKGSFTGALQARRGLFQEADGGTLFLDEIGDMSLCLQAKLLRVLQDHKIRSVGDSTEKLVNVRILAATHRDLRQSIRSGQFREDLYYRIHVVDITLPPLCERRADIPPLVHHFVSKYFKQHKLPEKVVPWDVVQYLSEQEWPGNIRQLENTIERALVVSRGQNISIADLGLEETPEIPTIHNPELPSLRDIEMQYISYVLARTNGKKEKAAKILKIDRTTLHRKLTEATLPNPNPGTDLRKLLMFTRPLDALVVNDMRV